jgi:hypothetical protein
VTGEENVPLVKLIFSKIKRRGPKERRPVTNMYGVVVIPEGEKETNTILN